MIKMRYRITGYGHTEMKILDNDMPRGDSTVSLADLQEHIAWALWVDKCRYVTVEAVK